MIDLSFLQSIVPDLARLLNLPPSTVLLYMFIIVAGANLVSKLIPDDATGIWAVIRKLCNIIGVAASNRVSAGVKTSDVVKAVVEGDITVETPLGTIGNLEGKVAFPGLKKENHDA